MRKLLLALGLLFCINAFTVEQIHSYTSEIAVNPDGSMTVRETITVNAEGDQIRRGIYREFPTDYVDRGGNRVRVRFEVISVRRNEGPVDWSVKAEGNGKRVYMGSMSQTIPPGMYTYELTYQTDRQLGFFETYDELYWNVTGDEWAFPILRAEAVVVIPGEGTSRFIEQHGYTGPKGSTETAVSIAMDPSGKVV